MANGAQPAQGKGKRKSSNGLLLFRALKAVLGGSRPGQVFLLLLFAAMAVVVVWQIPAAWMAVGYGVWIAAPLAVLFLLVLRFRPRAAARRWRLWLAGIPFALVAWGILGFIAAPAGALQEASLGGTFGSRTLIGAPGVPGALRLLGLATLGIVLVAPGWSWRSFKAAAGLAGRGIGGAYAAGGRATWWAGAWAANQARERGPRIGQAARSAAQAGAARAAALVGRLRGAKQAPDLAGAAAAAIGSVAVEPAMSNGHADALPDALDQPKEGLAEAPAADAARPAPTKPALSIPAGSRTEMLLTGPGNRDGWRLPSIDVLDREIKLVANQSDYQARARAIEDALRSYGIEGSVVEIHPGPAVTQFGVEPGWVRKFKEVKLRDEEGKWLVDKIGKQIVRREEVARTRVKVDAISNLDKDLAMALAASSIRIEAPIPGKALVGVEVPNATSETVSLRSSIDSPEYRKLKDKAKLPIVLGKGNGGQVEVADLAKMPHLLVAGATGSGKSIGIRATLVCLLMNKTPRELRLLLVDPKRVELVAFNSVPHLLTPAIVEVEKVVDALRWATLEMDERYKKFQSAEVRDLEAYNKHKLVADPLPYLLIVIDELADLMMTAPLDVESCITRLAQLGRASGIHLIVATQRPSVNVVTGLIKANFPTRLSFAVSSQVDSRTILDTGGAEKLLGKGDMLYLPQDASKPKRIQGAYVSDAEVERVVHAWNTQRAYLGPTHFPKLAAEAVAAEVAPASGSQPSTPAPPAPTVKEEKDPLMPKAREVAEQFSRVSASLLQRKLKIGYNKATRLMTLLEEEGYGAEEEDDVF